jgi:hypothetical protein
MAEWTCLPAVAWQRYILPSTGKPGWVEDSKDISEQIGLSKRELFSLIVLAHLRGGVKGGWLVGYDPDDGEPNDGYITDGETKLRIEHKVVAQMDKREVLNAIIGTYAKYAKKGASYGKHRILVINPNKSAKGLVKISDLGKRIGDQCPFDRVFIVGCVSRRQNGVWVMHITQQYPAVVRNPKGTSVGIGEVLFDTPTGVATVTHNGIDEDWKTA